ncbi:MAG: hypothetical protein L0211_12600 [Planctomycetaceae bacterium]|nr:hypothetical protein [Planctomycetaceae bacterium]
MDEERDDLDLLAFRYVAGEMRPEEAGEFELRMAEDQAARDAMSQAVALAERLLEARPAQEPLVRTRPVGPPAAAVARRHALRNIARPLGWMTAGAAAALLMVSLTRAPDNPAIEPRPGSVLPEASRLRPSADAVVWSQLHASQNWATADLERWLEEPPELANNDARDLLGSAAVPSWVNATSTEQPK